MRFYLVLSGLLMIALASLEFTETGGHTLTGFAFLSVGVATALLGTILSEKPAIN